MTPPLPAPQSDPRDTPSAARLIELLTRQRDRYRALSALAGQQQSLIAEGRTEELLTVLSSRQALVEELTGINRDIAPLRQRMSELSDTADDATRRSLRSLVDEVQAMLESIIDQDEHDRKMLEAARTRVGFELKRTAAAPQALGAYQTATPSSNQSVAARFTDVKH